MSKLSKMRKRREKLVRALRSGTYKKVENMLSAGDCGFCVQGVAVDLAFINGWIDGHWEEPFDGAPRYAVYPDHTYGDGYFRSNITAGDQVRKLYGLSWEDFDQLIGMNDGGSDFYEMAKFIEEQEPVVESEAEDDDV